MNDKTKELVAHEIMLQTIKRMLTCAIGAKNNAFCEAVLNRYKNKVKLAESDLYNHVIQQLVGNNKLFEDIWDECDLETEESTWSNEE